jgi:hypothetical protein
MFGSLPPIGCRTVHGSFTLFVFVCVEWCSTHIVLSFCFVFLRLVYPMLPVSLDCPFPLLFWYSLRRVLRYQRGNQNPYIEKEKTIKWPKEKVQKDKQRSTKHTHKTKDRVLVIRTPLKTGGELRCSGRGSSSCSTSDTRLTFIYWTKTNRTKLKTTKHDCKDMTTVDIL